MTTTMKINLVGSSAPLGFFDPLGFSKGGDAAKLNRYRESELKHGRVAMVSFLFKSIHNYRNLYYLTLFQFMHLIISLLYLVG